MKTHVQKWGNSLALRIPKSFAAEAGLSDNAAVELSLVEGALVVRPVTPQPLTLDERLRGITDNNIPIEWNTGPAVGKEGLVSRKRTYIPERRRCLDHPRSASRPRASRASAGGWFCLRRRTMVVLAWLCFARSRTK